jgi:hypothetical protein
VLLLLSSSSSLLLLLIPFCIVAFALWLLLLLLLRAAHLMLHPGHSHDGRLWVELRRGLERKRFPVNRYILPRIQNLPPKIYQSVPAGATFAKLSQRMQGTGALRNPMIRDELRYHISPRRPVRSRKHYETRDAGRERRIKVVGFMSVYSP